MLPSASILLLPALILPSALPCAQSSAAQQTQVQTASSPLQPSSTTDFTLLARFNTALGRLLRVDAVYVTTLERDFALENEGTAAGNYNLDQTSTLELTLNGYTANHNATRNYAGSLPAYDSVTDFAGASGFTAPLETLTETTRATSANPPPSGFVTSPDLAPLNFSDSPNGGGIFSTVLFSDSSLSFAPQPTPFALAFEERAASSVTITYTYEQGEAFCTGDFDFAGAALNTCTACPCGNNAPPGSPSGCINSVGTSAELIARGNATFSTNTLELRLVGAVPLRQAVLFASTTPLPALPGAPCFGFDSGVTSPALDGLRCLGGSPRRLGTRLSDSAGEIGFTNAAWGGPGGGIVGKGGFFPGQTVLYQAIYRDDPLQSCGTGLATTQGRSVLASF